MVGVLLKRIAIDSAGGPVLAIAYRSLNVPQALMNLISITELHDDLKRKKIGE